VDTNLFITSIVLVHLSNLYHTRMSCSIPLSWYHLRNRNIIDWRKFEPGVRCISLIIFMCFHRKSGHIWSTNICTFILEQWINSNMEGLSAEFSWTHKRATCMHLMILQCDVESFNEGSKNSMPLPSIQKKKLIYIYMCVWKSLIWNERDGKKAARVILGQKMT